MRDNALCKVRNQSRKFTSLKLLRKKRQLGEGVKANRQTVVAPREDGQSQPTGGAQSQIERRDSSMLDTPSGVELRTAEQISTELAARETPPADTISQ